MGWNEAIISNEAYSEDTWNGVGNITPSKNAVRDKIETLVLGEVAVLSYVADALVTYGSGTEFTKATLDAALAAIETVDKTVLLLAPGVWTITDTSDYSAYGNVTFDMSRGAVFAITNTKTLTLPSPSNLIAQKNQQIVSGLGLVSFAKPGTVYPEWWGTDGTADQVEINKAFASLAAGGKVELCGALYTVSSYIVPTAKTTLHVSPATVVKLADGVNTDIVKVSQTNVVIEGGGTIDGNHANQTEGWPSGVRIEASNVKVLGMNITHCKWAGIVTEGLELAHISNLVIASHNDINDCDADGITVGNWCDTVKIVDNYVHGNGANATTGNRRGISTLQYVTDLLIQGNTVSDNYENGIYIWFYCSGVRILDNYVANNNHFGIETASVGCLIRGNHVVGNGGQTTDDGGIFAYRMNLVEGNFCDANVNHGIYVYEQWGVNVSNNLVRNTTTVSETVPNGIRLYEPTYCLVKGNIAWDDQGDPTQTYGFVVTEVTTVNGTPFVGNIAAGNTYNYVYGASEETPLVGNIFSATGYELGGRDRATGYVATIADHLAFDPAFYRTMLLNGGEATRNINPTGTFRACADVWLKNTGSTNNLVFDSTGLNQALTPGQIGYFVYNGTAWTKMYVGS